jgi:hypothetical protein
MLDSSKKLQVLCLYDPDLAFEAGRLYKIKSRTFSKKFVFIY